MASEVEEELFDDVVEVNVGEVDVDELDVDEVDKVDIDPYAGKPETMSEAAWDNLNETTKLQYSDPNSEMNRSVKRIEEKTTAEEELFDDTETVSPVLLSKNDDDEKAILSNAISNNEINPSSVYDVKNDIVLRRTLNRLNKEIVSNTPQAILKFLKEEEEETGYENSLDNVSEQVKILLNQTLIKDEEEAKGFLKDKSYGRLILSNIFKKSYTIDTGMALGTSLPKMAENADDMEASKLAQNILFSEKEYVQLAKAVDAKLKDENNVRSGLTKMLIDAELDLHQIAWLTGIAEFAPITGGAIGARQIPIHARETFKALANGEPWDAAKHGAMAGVETLAAMASTIPPIKVAWNQSIRSLYKMSGFNANKQMSIINAATARATKETTSLAKKTRLENRELNDRLILEYEAKVSESQGRIIKISKQATDKEGKKLGYLVIDPELSRSAGLDTTKNMKSFTQERMDAFTNARYKPKKSKTENVAFQNAETEGINDVNSILANRKVKVESTKEWKRLRRLETEEGADVTERLVALRTAWNETDLNIIYGSQGDDYLNPLLDSTKFDAIVSVASELLKSNPDAFGQIKKVNLKFNKYGKMVKTKPSKKNDDTLIDQLFDYSLVNKLDGYNSEFTDILSKYGLTFDDYVLAVVGSGSEAGKILNKLSQLKRTKNFDILKNMEDSVLRQSGSWSLTANQLENIRKGFMVSRIQTTMRNMRSAIIRSPLVGMDNVFQAGIRRYSDPNIGGKLNTAPNFFPKTRTAIRDSGVYSAGSAINPLYKDGTWKGAFRGLHYMYQEPALAKELSQFILDGDRLGGFDMLVRNANEVRTMSGSTIATSPIIEKLSKLSDILNVPNRLQDRWVAEATFAGEVERLVHLEWKGVDYLKELKAGNVDKFMNNSSKFRPEGAMSFQEIVKASMDRTLDLTYRLGPQSQLLKEADKFIKKFGVVGSAFIPFPKFVFGAMELMADHTYGGVKTILMRNINRARMEEVDDAASIRQLWNGGDPVTTRKFQPITLRQSEQISRNITGTATIFALMQYRRGNFTDGNVNADYKLINNQRDILANTDYSKDAPMANRLQGTLIFNNVEFGNSLPSTVEIVKVSTDINKNLIVYARKETGELITIGRTSPNFKVLQDAGFDVQGSLGIGVEDTTPVFPLRQGLFIAEWANRLLDGTSDTWYRDKATFYKELVQTFTGSSFRTGSGSIVIDDIAAIINGVGEEHDIKGSKGMNIILRAVGSYVATYGAAFNQISDIQMAMGIRDTEAKNTRVDQKLSSMNAAWEAFIGPARSQGLTTLLPESVGAAWNTGLDNLLNKIAIEREETGIPPLFKEETEKYIKDLFNADGITIKAWNDFPAKNYLYGGGDRINILKKFLGYTEKTKEQDEGEWLTDRGFVHYLTGLKSPKQGLKEKVHKHFNNNYLQDIVEIGKMLEEDALEEWTDPSEEMAAGSLAANYSSVDEYIANFTGEHIHTLIRNGMILSKNAMLDEMDYEDKELYLSQQRLRKTSKSKTRSLYVLYLQGEGKFPDVNDLEDMERLMGAEILDFSTGRVKKGDYKGGYLQILNKNLLSTLDFQEGKSPISN